MKITVEKDTARKLAALVRRDSTDPDLQDVAHRIEQHYSADRQMMSAAELQSIVHLVETALAANLGNPARRETARDALPKLKRFRDIQANREGAN